MFAQLIEHLPMIGSEIEADFLKNEDLINKLILDYLSKNANIAECETCVGLEEVDFEPNNYEPEVEDESEAIYQEHIEQQKAEQESEDNVFEMHDVILDFLSYLGVKIKELTKWRQFRNAVIITESVHSSDTQLRVSRLKRLKHGSPRPA